MNILKKIRSEWFLLSMVGMIIIAVNLPHIGASSGPLHLNVVTQYGIALVFFIHGIGLSPTAIRKGLSNWRLHVVTQMATFVLYPLIWLMLSPWLTHIIPQPLAFGFCYLLVLPSTISSSVTMTAMAGGNIPGAIFNASLSSILGIVITPFFVQIFIGFGGGHMDLQQMILHIAALLLLPMILGQLARPLLHSWVSRYKAVVGKIDKWVILLIVLNAFSDSVLRGIWHQFKPSMLVTAIALCIVILLIVMLIVYSVSRLLHFSHEDLAAALFCGTKKTLAAGIPMAKVIFGTNPMLGMLLLPIMLYHPLQIFACAMVANKMARQHPQAV